MSDQIKCKCGEIVIQLPKSNQGTHGKCYCASCRGSSLFAGASDRNLDAEGGVDVFQTTPDRVAITKGSEYLSVTKITEKGLHRWECNQCQTPIANSNGKSGFPFIGIILPQDDPDKWQQFGAPRGWYKTDQRPLNAQSIERKDHGIATIIFGVLTRAIGAFVRGVHKKSDWHTDDGQWKSSTAKVLSTEERGKLYEMAKAPL